MLYQTPYSKLPGHLIITIRDNDFECLNIYPNVKPSGPEMFPPQENL